MKKFFSGIITSVILATSVLPTPSFAANSAFTKAYGWYEAIHLEWSNDANASAASVEYKADDATDYVKIDSELVRTSANGGVADIVGITSGVYDIKVTTGEGEVIEKQDVSVAAKDRSGYGFYGLNGGMGGYNKDGTPKSDATIVYVDNSNKNTVTAFGQTGIVKILSNATGPLIVRVIGTVDTQTRDADGTKTTDANNGVVSINNLTDRVLSDDSYFNMCSVSGKSNITIEGIGEDAVIEKWGFCFSKCNSVEIANLTFTKYPEDACSIEGSSSSNSSYKNFWIHNNCFKKGENFYDLTPEQDKGDGDGSTDFKGCRNITYSYNVFEDCHKTSLHGGGDSSLQYNSTWHHNYFNNCGARLPLTRQTNLHVYNNFYYNCFTGIDARASAWVLAEGNYFDYNKGTGDTQCVITRTGSYGYPIIKLFDNVFVNSARCQDKTGTIVTAATRDQVIDAQSLISSSYANKNPYPNFDTDPTVFYYNTATKRSAVTYLTGPDTAKADSEKAAGTMADNKVLEVYMPGNTVEPYDPTTGSTTESTEATTEAKVEISTVSALPLTQSDIFWEPEGGDKALNYVEYRQATDDYKLIDNSADFATVWSNSFEEQKNGIVIISGKVTPTSANSKWAFLRIMGKDGSGAIADVCSLASDENKNLCLKTGTDNYAANLGIMQADFTYDYSFMIDLDNKTVTLTVNGKVYKADITADSVDTIYMMTAKTDTKRSVIATLPSVVKAVALQEESSVSTEASTETTTSSQDTTSRSDGNKLPGDVDSNNTVNRADYIAASQFFAGKTVDINMQNMDVDASGTVNRADYVILSSFFAGKNVVLK